MITKLMTIEEVSDYLRVSVDTLYHWRVRGYGPTGIRVGKHVRYRVEDVENWVEKQRKR